MKIVCLCDNVIDHYQNTREMFPGGQAVNVSALASILGYQSYYLGNIADDKMGQVIEDALKQVGVDITYAKKIPHSSTKSCLYDVVDGERQFIEVVIKEDWANMGEYIPTLDIMKTADIVHCSVNSKIPEQVSMWTDLDGILVYDFGEKEKYRTDEYLGLVGSRIDLALFSTKKMNEEEAKEFVSRMHSFGIRNIILTMGDAGQYFSNGTELIYHPIQKIKALDTMGAGDAFITACMISLREDGFQKNQVLLDREMILRAMDKGSAYAALNCQKEGAFGIKVNY